jgi:transcriptional regulator with XRE-family HTH domain
VGKSYQLNFCGKNLKTLIKSRGITYVQLAKKCGISYQYLLNIMSGQKPFHLELLDTIRRILELSIEETCAIVVDNSISEDESGKHIYAFLLRRKNQTPETARRYYDYVLKEKYGEFSESEFRNLVIREVRESYYDESFKSFDTDPNAEGNIFQQIRYQLDTNEDFREIMKLLMTLSDKNLHFIRKSLELYIENH